MLIFFSLCLDALKICKLDSAAFFDRSDLCLKAGERGSNSPGLMKLMHDIMMHWGHVVLFGIRTLKMK